jgi:hypothetical protein
MKKTFSFDEALILSILSSTAVLFFVPILGEFPLIENDFFFYGTMLPLIVLIILGFVYSKNETKKRMLNSLIFVGISIGSFTLIGVDFQDLYFLGLSLLSFLAVFGIFSY